MGNRILIDLGEGGFLSERVEEAVHMRFEGGRLLRVVGGDLKEKKARDGLEHVQWRKAMGEALRGAWWGGGGAGRWAGLGGRGGAGRGWPQPGGVV